MEYQKASCLEVSGELCLHCKWNDWIGPKCNRTSKPIPDPKNLMHYLMSFKPHLQMETEEIGKPTRGGGHFNFICTATELEN